MLAGSLKVLHWRDYYVHESASGTEFSAANMGHAQMPPQYCNIYIGPPIFDLKRDDHPYAEHVSDRLFFSSKNLFDR